MFIKFKIKISIIENIFIDFKFSFSLFFNVFIITLNIPLFLKKKTKEFHFKIIHKFKEKKKCQFCNPF